MYKTKPVMEIGEAQTLRIERTRICIVNYAKDRLLCKEISPEDQVIISRILLTNVREYIERIMNEISRNIKDIDKKIDELISKLEQPKIYQYYNEAVGDIEYKIRDIQNLIKDYEKLIQEFNRYAKYKSLVVYALSNISQLQYDANIELENDFWFF